jgi:hypothetical protein
MSSLPISVKLCRSVQCRLGRFESIQNIFMSESNKQQLSKTATA